MTAQDVVTRIREQLARQGVTWREGGRDTFKAGKPETEVRGIATTGMSTFDVLRRAAAAGKNLDTGWAEHHYTLNPSGPTLGRRGQTERPDRGCWLMTSPTSTGWLATPRFCCPWRKEAGRGCVLRPVAGPGSSPLA